MSECSASSEKKVDAQISNVSNNTSNSIDNLIVNFILPDGELMSVKGYVGLSLLEIARKHDIPIEGACEGSLACSTCHVIAQQKWFDKLPPASDAEEDMLDLAFGLTQTSRLCCQVIFTTELNGITVEIPKDTRNVML